MNRLLLCTLALLIPMMAHAEGKQCPLENVDGDEVLNAEWKPFTYMGIKAGANHLLTNTVADPGTAYGAYAGRRFSELFAVEADYTFLGATTTPTGGHATAVSISGVHQIDFSWISLIGKLGIAQTNLVTPLGNPGGTKTSYTYGVGIEIPLNIDLSLRVMWDTYKIATPTIANDNVLYGGITYRF